MEIAAENGFDVKHIKEVTLSEREPMKLNEELTH